MKTTPAKDIDSYIRSFPSPIQKMLKQLREIINHAAPGATEKIGYAMPAFFLHENLVYFAGYKNHIGFYPSSSGIREFNDRFGKYKWSKGAVQFPLNEPLPVKLISDIVKFRVKEAK
jgi:uncharacterized protein YdhG (YjbR/CyaY superfamily)